MNIIDEILNEWSFRCDDGIVDLNDYDKVIILREILNEESNEELDSYFANNASKEAIEAIDYIKNSYNLEDNNFKITTKNSFKILLPDKYKISRTELMKDLEQNPDFNFDKDSIGRGSSIGRLKYKNKVVIYIKFAKGQGSDSAGKNNEISFMSLINNNTLDGPITVILKSQDKELKYNNIIEAKDASTTDAIKYAKADVQLLTENNTIIANISLKKKNAIRWESSKRRMDPLFDNFINKSIEGEFDNISLQPIQGSKNKFKLFNPQTNKILSKVVVINTPEEVEEGVVFGIDNPKTIVIKDDFEQFKDYTFVNNILTINCNKIINEIKDIKDTDEEPIFAFSNHIAQKYGIEFRVFSKGLLYKDNILKGSSVEIDYNKIK